MTETKLRERIDFSRSYVNMLQMQQDVRDRWFRFYLLLAAGFFTAAAYTVDRSEAGAAFNAIMLLVSVAMITLGLIFLAIFVAQTVNIRAFTRFKTLLDRNFILVQLDHSFGLTKVHEKMFKTRKPGADRLFLGVHALLVAIYVGCAAYFGDILPDSDRGSSGLAVGLGLCFLTGLAVYGVTIALLNKKVTELDRILRDYQPPSARAPQDEVTKN